jgi:acetyl esterase/lipase
VSEVFDEAAIAGELRSIGARFDPDILQRTRALYRPAVASLPWSGRAAVPDLAYGPAERHRLDVYPAGRQGAPVVIFLHGGGFVGGGKSGDPLFYSNVGRYFAAHGFLAIVANYRLAPASVWPSGIEDVAAIIDWVARHAREHGGDAERIVLVGQSAGAAHVAGYLFNAGALATVPKAVRGVALMSGFYRATPPLVGGPRSYFGDDEARWHDRSPATHVAPSHPPLLLSVAEFDPSQIAGQTLDFAAALNEADGRPPQLLWFEGHNHVSTVHGLGLGRDAVGCALRAFAEQAVS